MKHWTAPIGIALALAVPASGFAENVSTVGAETTSADASATCRGSKFVASRDGVLLSADIKASDSNGEAMEWHVYESAVETSG